MTQGLILGCVGLLIAFALVRGYTTKVLSQLRREYGTLVAQVHQLQADRDQAQILHESAVAQHNQVDGNCKDFRNELTSLAEEIAHVEEELGRGALSDAMDGAAEPEPAADANASDPVDHDRRGDDDSPA